MASRNRLRRTVNETLAAQFRDWGLPRDIEYKSYCDIVDNPVAPRALQKSFYNWKIAVKSVELSNPELFAAAPEPQIELTAEIETAAPDPLEALSQAADAEEASN